MNKRKMDTICGIIFLGMIYLSFLVIATVLCIKNIMPDLAYTLITIGITFYLAFKIRDFFGR